MNLDPAYISELQQQYPFLDSIPPEYLGTALMVLAIVTIVIGLIQCFLGYKLMKLCFAIAGFFLGGTIGVLACSAADLKSVSITAIVGLICAILGAIMLFKLYRIGVFLLDGILAFLLCMLLLYSINSAGDPSTMLLISGVAAVVVGILGVIFIRPVTIFFTSVSGGIQAGHGIIALVLGSLTSIWGIVAGVVLAILGMIVQFKTTKKPEKKGKREKKNKGAPEAPAAEAFPPVSPAPAEPVPAETHAHAPQEDTEG